MPSVRGLIADGNHNTRGLTRLEDDRHVAALSSSEVRIYEFVSTAPGRLCDRDIALRGPLGHPGLKLVSDVAQGGTCHWIDLSIRIEEADDPLRLLERLNQPIQQNAVETTIMPTDAIFVVLEEGIHDRPSGCPATAGIVAAISGPQTWLRQLDIPCLPIPLPTLRRGGYQGQSPWLVRRRARYCCT